MERAPFSSFGPSLTWLLFLSRSLLCLFPVPTCPFLVSARAAVTELLLERKSHFFGPVFSDPLFACFLVGKASLRQLTEKRRTQSEPKFRRRRRGTRHPSRPRRARRALAGPVPSWIRWPARPLRPAVACTHFPRPSPPFFLLLAPELPKKKMVRPSVAVRSFFPSRLALRPPPPPRPRLLSTCERELAPWPPPRSSVTPSTVPR